VAETFYSSHPDHRYAASCNARHLFLTQRAGGAPLMKITDFGTAKLMRDGPRNRRAIDLTATAMFGLSYSSPELLPQGEER
jgi:serine/threonine-protein kinase